MAHAFHVRWRTTANGNITSTMAAGETVSATVQDREILLLDARTGETRWRFTSLVPITSEIAGDGAIYVGCDDGTIVALAAATGAERWRVRATDENAPVALLGVVDGALIGVSGKTNETLLALETERGRELWLRRLGESPCHAAGSGVVVYAGNAGHVLVAVEPRTGHERWRRETDEPVAFLEIGDGSCFGCTAQGTVVALATDSGRERWQSALTLDPWNFLVAHGVVMVRGQGAPDPWVLWALHADTGTRLWATHEYGPYWMLTPLGPGLDGTAHFLEERETIVTLAVATGEERWQFIGGICQNLMAPSERRRYPTPAIVGELTYIGGDDGTVLAIEQAAPRVRWHFAAGGYIKSSPPAIGGDVVYVCWSTEVEESGPLHAMPAWTGTVQALSASTGTVLWAMCTGGLILSPPVVADGRVYVGCLDLFLYCLDATNGEVQWSFPSRDYKGVNPGGFRTTPIVHDGVVYAAGEDEFVYALDAVSGAVRWRLDTESTFVSNPALAGETLVVASSLHGVLGLDAATGRERWRFPFGLNSFRSPTIADGTVYITSVSGATGSAVHALDAQSGIERWRVTTHLSWELPPYPAIVDEPVQQSGGRIDSYHPSHSHPVVANGVVHALSEANVLFALDAATGGERWRFASRERITAARVLVDGTLYVAGGDCTLYAVDAETGAEHWRFATGPDTTTPVVRNGVLHVGSVEGLYALELFPTCARRGG